MASPRKQDGEPGMWWSDPNDERVKAALEAPCQLCGAKVGVQCRSITSEPLNRPVHIFRLEPK